MRFMYLNIFHQKVWHFWHYFLSITEYSLFHSECLTLWMESSKQVFAEWIFCLGRVYIYQYIYTYIYIYTYKHKSQRVKKYASRCIGIGYFCCYAHNKIQYFQDLRFRDSQKKKVHLIFEWHKERCSTTSCSQKNYILLLISIILPRCLNHWWLLSY